MGGMSSMRTGGWMPSRRVDCPLGVLLEYVPILSCSWQWIVPMLTRVRNFIPSWDLFDRWVHILWCFAENDDRCCKEKCIEIFGWCFPPCPTYMCILHKQHKMSVMYEHKQQQMNRNIHMLDSIRVKDNSNHPSLPNLYILHPLRTQWVFYYCRIRNVNRQWYPIQFCGRWT